MLSWAKKTVLIPTSKEQNGIPAVTAELTEPAETTAPGGTRLCFVKSSRRRGLNSSFCSLCPSLWSKIKIITFKCHAEDQECYG